MNKHSHVAPLVLAVLTVGGPVLAQNDNGEAAPQTGRTPSRVIEEVIVSAQKRDEAIQDVPISMSVLTEDFIVEQGVTDLREALLYVPNVNVESAGFFAAPRARGFTFNNNNKAFEPPLGLAIDGVPYTRIPYFMSATFDLKRIEVLRGPQGTTFGKNTTAGVIHILTADPTPEFTGNLRAQGGEFDRKRLEASLAGPIIDNVLHFRVAGFKEERDGFVENTTDEVNPQAQQRFRGYDRNGLRVKLELPDLAGSRLKLTYEKVDLEDFGTGFEIIRASDDVKAFLRNYDPNTDFEQGNFVASLDSPDGSRARIETYHLEWNYDLRDWGLVVVGSHSVLEHELELDTDFSPAPAIFGLGEDESPTDTAEMRLVSPPLEGLFGLDNLFGWNLGSSDLIAGVFYQDRAINDSEFRFIFDMPAFLGLTVAAGSDGGADLFALLPVIPGGTFVEDVSQTFEQQAETISAFAEFRWHFLDNWTAQVGARQGREKKQAQWHQYYNQPQPAVILPEAGLVPFQAERDLDDDQLQYKLALNWQPTDNISLFLHKATGVKSGGFNAFAFRDVDDELTFGPEYTTEWSFDAKTSWLDNTLLANVSVFRMDVDDFQVLTRDPERANIGIGVTLVKNAATARSQGVEGDIQWRPLNWLTLIGTVGYNDTEYLKFTDNECPADQPEAGGCDATGKSFPFAPEWNNSLTALATVPLFIGLEFTASATVEQYSEQYLDLDLDERKLQDGFERYKASVGLAHPEQGWSLKLIGENLTDEKTGIRQGDLFAGIFVEIAEQPRTYYAQFSWMF